GLLPRPPGRAGGHESGRPDGDRHLGRGPPARPRPLPATRTAGPSDRGGLPAPGPPRDPAGRGPTRRAGGPGVRRALARTNPGAVRATPPVVSSRQGGGIGGAGRVAEFLPVFAARRLARGAAAPRPGRGATAAGRRRPAAAVGR